jgi:NADH:ubiquinone oxidoreductase subunit 3 (subunit A)
MPSVFSSPPFIVLFSVIVGAAIYWIGGKLKAKGEASPGKEEAYACGENMPAVKTQVNIQSFFMYAFYFMIFDILAFVLVTSFGTAGIYATLYTGIVFLAIIVLPKLRTGD